MTPSTHARSSRKHVQPGPGPARHSAGLALIEVLVAMAVLAIGLGTTLRLQTWLRAATDLSRQRAEALRLLQNSHEALRAHTTSNEWSAIASTAGTALAPTHANTTFTLTRNVVTQSDPPLKRVSSNLSWPDREGETRQLQLDTLLAGQDPALSGALMLNRLQVSTTGSIAPRHGLIPPRARSLGDGRSAFKPRAQDTLTWVIDDTSGRVVARCDSTAGLASEQLDANSLGACRAIAGLLIQGHVRFAIGADTLTAVDAQNPLDAALPLDLRLRLSSTGHPDPGWECADDAPDAIGGAPAQLSVAYHCVVQGAGLPPRWSGRLDITPIGWTLADTGVTGYRVCRYSADHNRNGRIDNAEHPASHGAVGEPLGDQNFLIVRAAAACPQDSGVSIVAGAGSNWLDDSTAAHQP